MPTLAAVTEADRKLVEDLRSSGALDAQIAANRIEALAKERDEAVLHAGRCSLNDCALNARNREAKKLREEVEALTKVYEQVKRDQDVLKEERDEVRRVREGADMKPGDFVRVRGSRPPRYARIVEVSEHVAHLHAVDGWAESARLDEVICVFDIAEVWQAIEVEQSRIDRRLADLNKTRTLAFERALKAGR